MSKPVNSSSPHFQGPRKNSALSEYINESSNAVHQAHVKKAEEIKTAKTQFNPPKVFSGPGNPWIQMENKKK